MRLGDGGREVGRKEAGKESRRNWKERLTNPVVKSWVQTLGPAKITWTKKNGAFSLGRGQSRGSGPAASTLHSLNRRT